MISRRLPKGTVLVSCIGSIGKIGILEVEATCNQQINAIIPNANVSSAFLAYSIYAMKNEMISRANAPVVPIINKTDFSKYTIPIPPLTLQQSIVAELDNINNLINIKKSQLKDLDNLAQSIFYEMFGDPIENEKGWDVKKFGDVCTIVTDGEHATPRRSQTGIYLLSARNVHNHRLVLDDVDFIDEEEYNRISKRIVPQKDDILISCSGSVGRVCLAPDIKFQMVRSVALLRVDRTIIAPVFFEYLICSDYVQRQIDGSKVQVAQANLFQGKIRALKGILPPLALQQKFAEKIEAIEKHKQIVNVTIKDLETLLASRMQFWFE